MILDFVYIVIFLLIGFNIPSFFLRKDQRIHKRNLKAMLLFQFLFAIAQFFFTRNGAGDAWDYWVQAKNMSSAELYRFLFEEKGTFFIYAFNYLPAKLLGMSFFSNTLFYSLIGYIGSVFFYLIVLKLIPYNSEIKGVKLFPLLFFLPSLHFWSSAVGKDALLFFCIGAFGYGMLNITKRIPILILSVLLSYLVRPHITLILFLSFGMAYLFDAKTSPLKRMFFIIALFAASIAIFPIVIEYIGVGDNSVKGINERLASQSVLLGKGSGSAIDISNYPLIFKVLTFLYRPFFFDVNGIPALVSSFENLFLVILSYKAFRYKFKKTFLSAPFVIKGFAFFLLIGAILFGSTLGNLGIIVRMRNMFLPGMLIYFLWAYSFSTQLKLDKLKTRA